MGHYRPIIIILYVQQFNVLTGFEPESPGVPTVPQPLPIALK